MALSKRRRPRSSCIKRTRQGIGPESKVQMQTLDWLKLYHPDAFEHVIKIDNEGKRTPYGHQLAIAQGLHIGAADIFLAWPTNAYCGLWLEVKREKWKLIPSNREHTERQYAFLNKMIKRGFHADMGIGVNHCCQIIKDYLNT